MKSIDEVDRGIETLREILTRGRIMHLREPERFRTGNGFLFTVTAYSKTADFQLTREVLADLPGMSSYRQQAMDFAAGLERRLRNPVPSGFMTRSGLPVQIESYWPQEAWSGRLASFVRTDVRDLRTQKLAKCIVTITEQQQHFELLENPFLKFQAIVNSVRTYVDQGKITFYDEQAHPDNLQQVNLRLKNFEKETAREQDFLFELKEGGIAFCNAAHAGFALDDYGTAPAIGGAIDLVPQSRGR